MGTKILEEQFGEKLRAAREEQGLTQMELQKRTGVNIWRLENGRVDPTFATLDKLARGLGLESVVDLIPDELLG